MPKSVEQFRIFLSSPGDVQAERDIARKLIKEVLPYSPFIRRRATFDVVSWDDPHAAPGLDAHLTPQEAINRQLPKPSECDVVIVILWSRMGTPMPSEYTKADGSPYQSGTEWEFHDAASAAGGSGRTSTLLYRRTEEPLIGARDPEAREKFEQVRKVDDFFERFQAADGSLSGSFSTYETVEKFRTRLRQNLESVVARLLGDVFSEELGVTKAAVDSMMAILKEQEVPPEQLETKLKEIAERHLELTEKLHQLSRSNDEPEVASRREQAAEAIEQGEYDRADALLAEAVVIDRTAIDEQQEALDRRKLSAAATIAQQGELERARLNYPQAARHFAEAADLVQPFDSDAALHYALKQASVLYDQGEEFGDNSALVEAIDTYRSILAKQPRERVPLDWASTQSNLSIMLRALGERETGTSRLHEAVGACRAALEERTRERVPLDWATTQSNLAAALWALGKRESGTSRLEEAVGAFRATLEERTRERLPLDWATTQNNLGAVLGTLGERENGTSRLEEAVVAFRAALEERRREHAPRDWATTQNNLGTALTTLGERETGMSRLEESVNAYRNALEEMIRERIPLDWATTQNNLGDALQTLGEREIGTARLEESVIAYRNALEEWTRERVPLDWAMTQNNLGGALLTLGERTGEKSYLEDALGAVSGASEVFLNEADHIHRETEFNERIAEIEAAIARLS